MIYIYTALRFPELLKKLNQFPFTSCTDPDFDFMKYIVYVYSWVITQKAGQKQLQTIMLPH